MQKESTPYKTANKKENQTSMRNTVRKASKRFLVYGVLSLFMWAMDFERSLGTALLLLIAIFLCLINGSGVLWFKIKTLYATCQRKLQNAVKSRNNRTNPPRLKNFELHADDFLKQRNQLSKLRLRNQKYKNTIGQQQAAAKELRKMLTANAANFIQDERDLDKYLTQHEEEKQTTVVSKFQQKSKASKEQKKNVLKNLVYQPAPLLLPTPIALNVNDEQVRLETDLQGIFGVSIRQEQMSKFVFNLRDWISATILKPLIDEIEYINGVLDHKGYSNLCIGKTPWHLLYSLMDNDLVFVNNYIPRLPVILKYLEVCSNQIYLMERLRELSIGAYLNAYQTSSSLLTKQTHLPNDAAIIFNFFCIYMDEQLKNGGSAANVSMIGRPFFDKYVLMKNLSFCANDLGQQLQIRNQTKCAILCSNPTQPKFNLVVENKLLQCCSTYNNLFYVLIAFLSYLQKYNKGCLEGVQLGRQGFSMLWILEIED